MSYLALAPLRVGFRVAGVAGRADLEVLYRTTRAAAEVACTALQRLFGAGVPACPEVTIVRGGPRHLAAFPLGLGRRRLLVVTEQLCRDLGPEELRFVLGREIGRLALRQSARWPWWALRR